MLQSLRFTKYFPFYKGNIFKTSILALILISVNFCLSQNLFKNEIKFINKRLESDTTDSFYLSYLTDTVSYPTLISFGIGASTYKFVNQYFYELNIFPYIGRKVYIKTGLILYRIKIIDYGRESMTDLLYANIYFLRIWEISKKINLFGGGGFSISPFGGIITNLSFHANFKLSSSFYTGLELKQCLYFGKDISKYIKYPSISFNFFLKI
jgi:hypothetical protein